MLEPGGPLAIPIAAGVPTDIQVSFDRTSTDVVLSFVDHSGVELAGTRFTLRPDGRIGRPLPGAVLPSDPDREAEHTVRILMDRCVIEIFPQTRPPMALRSPPAHAFPNRSLWSPAPLPRSRSPSGGWKRRHDASAGPSRDVIAA